MIADNEIYPLIGEDGFTRLVQSFYRQIADDDLLGPMYPKHDLEGAETRLRDFLVFRFGGPVRYLETRGHPRLRMRHMPFPIDAAARDRWVLLMENALQQAALPDDAAKVLRAFFANTATFLINRGPGDPFGAENLPG
jgi:hemoglobin